MVCVASRVVALNETKSIDPAATHKAQFSADLIGLLTVLLEQDPMPIHDPFAGPGVRLGGLATKMSLPFTGTDIECSFIVDPRVRCGDATDISTYPTEPYTIITSPAFGNGVSDGFQPRDSSTRNTYTSWIGELEGEIRHLHPNNQGRWGYRGRGPKSNARAEYWRIADEAVRCWRDTPCQRVLINVKDWASGGVVEPFTDDWATLLEKHGFIVGRRHTVDTRGLPSGSNHEIRVEHDVVIEVRRRTSDGSSSSSSSSSSSQGWLWTPWAKGMVGPDDRVWLNLSGKPTRRPPRWRGWSSRPWIELLLKREI